MSDPWEDYASKDGGPWSDYKSNAAVAEPPRTATPDQFTTPMGGTPRPLLDSSLPPPEAQTETIESDIIQPVEKVIGGAVATVANIIPNTYNAAVRMTGKGHPAEMWMTPGKPLTSKAFGEALEGAVNDVFAPNHPEPAIEGLAKSARKAVEGFTTPESIAALPLFEFKAGRVALMALMAASTPAQIAETHKVLTDPKATTVQKWESLGDSGIQLAMTAGMALGLKPEEVKSTMTPDEAAQKAQSLTVFTDQALAATKEKLTQAVGKEELPKEAASEPEKPKEEPKTEAVVASEPVPTEPATEPPKEQPKEIVDQPVNNPVEIPGQQFVAKTLGLVRKMAESWAGKNVVGTYENAATGWNIEVGKPGLKKTLSGVRNYPQHHIEAVAAIPELVRRAELKVSHPDRAGNVDIKAIHVFEAPVKVEGKDYTAKITVKETKDGKKFYDQSLLEPVRPAGESTASAPQADPAKPRQPAGKSADDAGASSASGGQQTELQSKDTPQATDVNTNGDTPQTFTGMGGAVPSEFEHSQLTPTGTKNATVDAERAKRGLPAAIEPLRKSFGEVWDKAMARIDREPEWLDGTKDSPGLIDELRDKPRALTDEEDAALLHRQVDLQNDYGKATRDLAQAHDDGNDALIQQAKIRTALLSDKLLDLYNIGKRSGAETGRGLNARKMMAYEDFSLAQMELSKRSANGGRALTDAERTEISDLNKRIEETQKAYDDYRTKAQERISKAESDATLNRIKAEESAKPQIHPAIIEAAKKIVAKLDTRADAARERLKARLGRTSAGLDPTVLADLAEIGASHLAHAVVDVAEWSAKMVSEFGDLIQPHIKEIYAASEKLVKDATKDNLEAAREMRNKSPEEQIKANDAKIGEKIKAGKKNDISWHVQRIARLLVQSGVTDREALIGRVHEILQKHLPDITRRETMDAISGYGDFKQLSKDQISLRLRGMKGEMQQIAKLEDMQAGTPPLKSGVERRTPTDVERELLKKVNDAKNKFRVPMTDAATQLKSALDTVKTRLKNEITDLETQISRKQKTIKEKAPVPSDAASDALKQRRDELKAEYKALFDDPEVAYQKALQEYKNRITKRTAELQDKISRGDYSKAPKRELKLDNEAMRLKAENERVKQKFQQGLMRDRLKNRNWFEKAQDTLVKWSRGFLLSGPSTLAKLTAAAFWRLALNPIEESVGYGLGKLPGISKISERAPSQGGASVRIEAKAITEGFSAGMEDAAKVLRTGKGTLDLLFGGPNDVGVGEVDEAYKSVIDFFGQLHGALKAPVKRAAFTRSFEKRAAFYMKQGVDVSDPMVQTRISVEAYKDANHDIFMQRNRYTDRVRRFINSLEEKDKTTGKTPIPSKMAATGLRGLMPIMRVPSNIVAETLQYAIGLESGSYKATRALVAGAEKLKPEEADLIMKELKKGSVGTGALLLGYFVPKAIGGFYQQGQKRDAKDVKYGGIRVAGHDVPKVLLHAPIFETMQLGATVSRVADSKLRKKDLEKQGIKAGALAGALGLVDDVPFIENMFEAGKLMNPNERSQYLGELAKSRLVPQMLSQTAEYFDKDAKGNPIKRKPQTVLQGVEAGIPGLRQNVPKKK